MRADEATAAEVLELIRAAELERLEWRAELRRRNAPGWDAMARYTAAGVHLGLVRQRGVTSRASVDRALEELVAEGKLERRHTFAIGWTYALAGDARVLLPERRAA